MVFVSLFLSLVLVTLDVSVLLALPTGSGVSSSEQETRDDLLRQLKRGLFSADSVMYHTRENLVQSWVKQDSTKHESLFEVITELSNLMDSKEMLQGEGMIVNNPPPRFEVTVIIALIDAVMEDACNWLTHVIAIGDFNCTATQVKDLAAQISAQQSVEKVKNALKDYKKLKGVGSCDWIKCKFWCRDQNGVASSSNSSSNETATKNSMNLIEYLKEYNDLACSDFIESDCNTC